MAEWRQETWIGDATLPLPPMEHVRSLITRCHALTEPGDTVTNHDAQVANFCQALMHRREIGWPVVRDL